MRVQVVIVGTGPAGLLLGRLLERGGVEALVLERRSTDYMLGRIRAGVLEHGTRVLLNECGVGTRMEEEGLPHDGVELCFDGEPMRFGRLFLAGDAAHIVPPTGAKGLNLAVSDVAYLAEAFGDYYAEKSGAGIDAYSVRALARVWKAERFSWWMTTMLHRVPEASPFGRRLQRAEFDHLVSLRSAARAVADNYVGLPM